MQAALGKQIAKSVDSKKRQTEITQGIKSLQGLQGKAPAPRASSQQSSTQDVMNDSNSYLPQLIEKIQNLVGMMEDPALSDFKQNSELKQKTNSLISCLRQSATQNQNKAFYANLTEISDTVDQTKYQLERYLKANIIMRKMIASDVRKKLRSLQSSMVFQERLIDSIYNSKTNQTLESAAELLASAHQLNFEAREMIHPQAEREFRRRIKQLAKQLEDLKQLQQVVPPQQIQIQNENQKKEKKKSASRKTTKELQNEKHAQQEAQLLQQKQVGGQLCMKADSLFFGIGQKADKEASIRLYEESAQNGSSKAFLALAAIYEPTDSTKAFFYYDKAAENEPYALFKLGQFMENGLYEEGFRGKPNAGFAFAYYKKATQQDVSCPEALFKLGEFYHKGIEVEKNIQLAIRKYEEAAAEGHVLAMNALGSLFYNDLKDYGQATEWFKKASEKGCARSLNNLGTCYEFGHGIQVDRDQAYTLYKEAASKGHVQAMLNLAYLTLSNAIQSTSDSQYKESAVWFRKLTMEDPKTPEPYYNLAKMHEYGLGTPKDFKQAFAYYKRAASFNHPESLSKCGDFVYSGKINGGLSDKIEAKKYYQKAAELGSATAINSLGLLIESQNKDEALTLYRQAHKLGNLDATVNFALIYLQTDPQAAKALLQLAVKKGHSRAAEYMVTFGLVPSVEVVTQGIDHDEDQILASIDAVVQTTPSRPSNRYSNLGQPGLKKVTETTDLQKPTHLISGSSGTHQHLTSQIQPAF